MVIISDAVNVKASPTIAMTKASAPTSSQVQRVILRQSDGSDIQVNSPPIQMKQQNQTNIFQSSTQPSTQTKMISAAELQKLISSGAVKTVTRASNVPQASTSVPSSQIIRQVATQEKAGVQHQAQQQVKTVSIYIF